MRRGSSCQQLRHLPTHPPLGAPLPACPQAWAGGVHWPDFAFNPQADEYWEQLLRAYEGQAAWAGLSLGMNEGACVPRAACSVCACAMRRGPPCILPVPCVRARRAVGLPVYGLCLRAAGAPGTARTSSPPLPLPSFHLPAVANFCSGDICVMPSPGACGGGRRGGGDEAPLMQASPSAGACKWRAPLQSAAKVT